MGNIHLKLRFCGPPVALSTPSSLLILISLCCSHLKCQHRKINKKGAQFRRENILYFLYVFSTQQRAALLFSSYRKWFGIVVNGSKAAIRFTLTDGGGYYLIPPAPLHLHHHPLLFVCFHTTRLKVHAADFTVWRCDPKWSGLLMISYKETTASWLLGLCCSCWHFVQD